jgi:hypothetical protein
MRNRKRRNPLQDFHDCIPQSDIQEPLAKSSHSPRPLRIGVSGSQMKENYFNGFTSNAILNAIPCMALRLPNNVRLKIIKMVLLI